MVEHTKQKQGINPVTIRTTYPGQKLHLTLSRLGFILAAGKVEATLTVAISDPVTNQVLGSIVMYESEFINALGHLLPGGELSQCHLEPDEPEPAEQPRMREVEYYRCWGGDRGTWDTYFIAIPADTPENQLDDAVRAAVARVNWEGDPPQFVGFYADCKHPHG